MYNGIQTSLAIKNENGLVRGGPLMIWVGLGQKREKKLNGYSPRKKAQLNNPEEKTQFNNLEEKKLTAGWPGKKTQQSVGRGKKLNANSLPGAPPDH